MGAHRMPSYGTERLRDPVHGSHGPLPSPQETIGLDMEEKVRLRGAAPATDTSAPPVALLTDQLAAMSFKHQEALAAAAFNAEQARLAEWDACQLRGQLGLAQQDFARTRNNLTTALAQAHTQVADLDDRLKEQLRSFCREYIDIFSTSVRPLPASVQWLSKFIERSGRCRVTAFPSTPFRCKATSHPHADPQTTGARQHRGIAGQRVKPSSPRT
jgi:hypothetical protein